MTVDLPDVWSDVDTSAGDSFGQISASTSIADWLDGQASGVGYYVIGGATAASDLQSRIDGVTADDPIIPTCQENELGEVSEGEGYSYIGNSYWSCNGTDSSYYVQVRSYGAQDQEVVIFAQFTTDQEVEFLNRSLGSLTVS